MTDAAPASAVLSSDVVEAWHQRIGSASTLGTSSTRYFARYGAEGLANYLPALDISVDEPEAFGEIAYWCPLSTVLAFVVLRTPCAMARTAELIERYPSNFAIACTQTIPGGGTVRAGGRDQAYDYPAQPLLILNNADEYIQYSAEIADPLGVWIPLDLLGDDARAVLETSGPLVSATPLARAASEFIKRFACDVAVRGAAVEVETERAVVDVVRSVIVQFMARGERRGPVRHPDDNAAVTAAITRDLVDQHFRDPDFGADAIAGALHMSRRHLYRLLAEEGVVLSEMIARRRIECAKELLGSAEGAKLDKVARAAGFGSAATLRNRFRIDVGMTPTEFRRSRRA